MIYSDNIRWVIRRAVSRTPGFLVVLVLAVILYLNTVGLPAWLAARITEKINSSGSVVLSSGVIRLSPLHMALVLEDVRLYRKKVLGPAAIEAKYVGIRLDPVALIKKKFCVRKLKITDGIIRPKLCSGPDVSPDTDNTKGRKATLVVELENCLIQGVNVVSLSADIHVEENIVRFDNIGGTLSHGNMRGDLNGQLVYDDKTRVLDGRLLTQLDPRLLIPLMYEWDMTGTVDLVSRFEFNKNPPKCKVTFRKLNYGLGDLTLDGEFSMQDCSYRGVDMIKANGRAHVELADPKALIKVEVAELVRKEGTVRTTFTIDLTKQIVAFDGMSGIHAPEFFQMVGVFTNECRQYFRFDGPVKIAASGVVDYGGLTNTNFRGIIETERMGIGPIMTENCSFSLAMVGLTTTATNVQGKVYGGKFSGSATFVIPSNEESNISYTVDAKVNDADFKEFGSSTVTEIKDVKYSGRLEGWAKISGIMGEGNGRTAVGKGYVSVKKGRIFTMPVFGGLTDFITKYVPGVDFILEQTDAKADFSIRDGKAHSDEILIEGGVLTLSGIGDFYFDRKLDFKVKVRLLKKKTALGKVIQFITDPISELFEFKLEGTLAKPKWSSLHL